MKLSDKPANEIRDVVALRMEDTFGNYHAYDWELRSVSTKPVPIHPNNPDPIIGDGERYYAVFYGVDENGIERELRVSINWDPETSEYGIIKYSSSDLGE